ncbi:MAG: hypothetical protein V4525_03740 [Pseudomonadota bacterium]
MFIFWGRKIVYRKIGYVADFCPICRSKQSFTLRRIGSASHVYYVSIGEGELVGFDRTCMKCYIAFNADPNIYTSVSKTNECIDTLTKLTFPVYEEVFQERLKIEAQLKNEPLSFSPQERHALIRSPFLLLSPKVEKRFASTHIDKEVGLSLVSSVILLLLGPMLIRNLLPEYEENVIWVFLCISILLVAWQGVQSGRRFMRREVLPILANTLQPLRPSENEITDVIAELKQLRHKIGSKLLLSDLQSLLTLNRT